MKAGHYRAVSTKLVSAAVPLAGSLLEQCGLIGRNNLHRVVMIDGKTPRDWNPERAEYGKSDGAKALSMWSNRGCIIKPEMSAPSRSGQKRPATRRRTVTGSAAAQQTDGDKPG